MRYRIDTFKLENYVTNFDGYRSRNIRNWYTPNGCRSIDVNNNHNNNNIFDTRDRIDSYRSNRKMENSHGKFYQVFDLVEFHNSHSNCRIAFELTAEYKQLGFSQLCTYSTSNGKSNQISLTSTTAIPATGPHHIIEFIVVVVVVVIVFGDVDAIRGVSNKTTTRHLVAAIFTVPKLILPTTPKSIDIMKPTKCILSY